MAQNRGEKRASAKQILQRHRETQRDEYIPVVRESRRTSPAFRISTPRFFAVQVNVSDSGQNIIGDAANEPSIAVDPANPARMAIGWRQFDTVASNFRQAGYGYSSDGGRTWRFPGVLQRGVFRSDPVLDSDSRGNFYFNSLTRTGSDYTCDVFKSTSGGATWGAGVFARGGDKQWMTIDKTLSRGNANIYAYWTQFWSMCYPEFFTRSTNDGASFEPCVAIPGEPFWGTLDVNSQGKLFVGGNDPYNPRFLVASSSTASDSNQVVSWDTVTAVNLGGDISANGGYSTPNPDGLLGQTWIAVDRSGGATNGYVYMLCSVVPFASSDPLELMFARSTNGGLTWDAPIRINDDATRNEWQWFGTMSVALNGRIDVIWLDTRDNPGTVRSSLYYSYSTNAGVTWARNRRLSPSFDPHVGWPQQDKMGDYFHMVSDNAGADLAWAGTFNGEQDVYYGRISFSPNAADFANDRDFPSRAVLHQNYPNPFNASATIRFALPRKERATLKVFDLLGREVVTLADGELAEGEHARVWDATDVASGVFFYRLRAGDAVAVKRMVLIR